MYGSAKKVVFPVEEMINGAGGSFQDLDRLKKRVERLWEQVVKMDEQKRANSAYESKGGPLGDAKAVHKSKMSAARNSGVVQDRASAQCPWQEIKTPPALPNASKPRHPFQ